MNIGQAIRIIRLTKGRKQSDIAKAAGIAISTLCDIEKGRVNPSLKSLEKLASALGVEVASLFDPQYVNNESTGTEGK